MIVCVCHRISDKDIAHRVSQGCMSFETLQADTGVSTCCGCCETCARDAFHDAKKHHHATAQTIQWLTAAPVAA